MLYFFMFIVFLLLIVGPVVASRFITNLPSLPLDLMQPTGQKNNDTTNEVTGSALNGLGGAATGGGGGGGGAAPTDSFAVATGFNY